MIYNFFTASECRERRLLFFDAPALPLVNDLPTSPEPIPTEPVPAVEEFDATKLSNEELQKEIEPLLLSNFAMLHAEWERTLVCLENELIGTDKDRKHAKWKATGYARRGNDHSPGAHDTEKSAKWRAYEKQCEARVQELQACIQDWRNRQPTMEQATYALAGVPFPKASDPHQSPETLPASNTLPKNSSELEENVADTEKDDVTDAMSIEGVKQRMNNFVIDETLSKRVRLIESKETNTDSKNSMIKIAEFLEQYPLKFIDSMIVRTEADGRIVCSVELDTLSKEIGVSYSFLNETLPKCIPQLCVKSTDSKKKESIPMDATTMEEFFEPYEISTTKDALLLAEFVKIVEDPGKDMAVCNGVLMVKNTELRIKKGVTELPEGIRTIDTSFYIDDDSTVASLPSSLHAIESLTATGNVCLTSLPAYLNVQHDVDVTGCTQLTALPNNLCIESGLEIGNISGAMLQTIGQNIRIEYIAVGAEEDQGAFWAFLNALSAARVEIRDKIYITGEIDPVDLDTFKESQATFARQYPDMNTKIRWPEVSMDPLVKVAKENAETEAIKLATHTGMVINVPAYDEMHGKYTEATKTLHILGEQFLKLTAPEQAAVQGFTLQITDTRGGYERVGESLNISYDSDAEDAILTALQLLAKEGTAYKNVQEKYRNFCANHHLYGFRSDIYDRLRLDDLEKCGVFIDELDALFKNTLSVEEKDELESLILKFYDFDVGVEHVSTMHININKEKASDVLPKIQTLLREKSEVTKKEKSLRNTLKTAAKDVGIQNFRVSDEEVERQEKLDAIPRIQQALKDVLSQRTSANIHDDLGDVAIDISNKGAVVAQNEYAPGNMTIPSDCSEAKMKEFIGNALTVHLEKNARKDAIITRLNAMAPALGIKGCTVPYCTELEKIEAAIPTLQSVLSTRIPAELKAGLADVTIEMREEGGSAGSQWSPNQWNIVIDCTQDEASMTETIVNRLNANLGTGRERAALVKKFNNLATELGVSGFTVMYQEEKEKEAAIPTIRNAMTNHLTDAQKVLLSRITIAIGGSTDRPYSREYEACINHTQNAKEMAATIGRTLEKCAEWQ